VITIIFKKIGDFLSPNRFFTKLSAENLDYYVIMQENFEFREGDVT